VIAIAVILLVIVVQDLRRLSQETGDPRKGIAVFKIVILSLFSVVLVIAFIFNTGIIMFRMSADYITEAFETANGTITEGSSGEGISKITITIDGNTFYLPADDEQILYEHTGESCEVTYGRRSKFIVDYSFIR